jgi:hypothetical protein
MTTKRDCSKCSTIFSAAICHGLVGLMHPREPWPPDGASTRARILSPKRKGPHDGFELGDRGRGVFRHPDPYVDTSLKPPALANDEVAIDLEGHHDAAALNTMPERFHAFASRRMTSL